MPGGNPVTELPGETPRLPVMTVAPVLVTVDPPGTAKLCAVPRLICAYVRGAGKAAIPTMARTRMHVRCMGSLLFVNCGGEHRHAQNSTSRICCSDIAFSHTCASRVCDSRVRVP